MPCMVQHKRTSWTKQYAPKHQAWVMNRWWLEKEWQTRMNVLSVDSRGTRIPEGFGTGKCLYSLRKSMTRADLGGRREVESTSGWSVTIAPQESACKD